MTEQQEAEAVLNAVKTEIGGLSQPRQDRIINISESLRHYIRTHGVDGYMALALLGAEFAAKERL